MGDFNTITTNSYYSAYANVANNNNVNISTVQRLSENKSVPNVALDNLSSLLADPSKVGTREDNTNSIKDKLLGIDQELTDMQNYLDNFNAQGELQMATTEEVLEKLMGMAKRLEEIQQELQQLAAESRQKGQDQKDQFTQLSQVSLLQQQIDAQREALKEQAKGNDAPSAPAVIQNAQAV